MVVKKKTKVRIRKPAKNTLYWSVLFLQTGIIFGLVVTLILLK